MTSMQERWIEIRAVDSRVAACAISSRLETALAVRHVDGGWIGVALQAQEAFFAPVQHHLIDTAVRGVAGGAAFHFDRGMLENEWAALFHVTVHACLPSGPAERGTVRGSVRIVAIGALHGTLRNPMMGRKCELMLNVPVASVAELRLRLLQQGTAEPSAFFGQLR